MALATSVMLWGGMLVDMPTAMPDEPLQMSSGKRPGRTVGSCFVSVVVTDEVDGLLLDVLEHVDRRPRHASLGVPHRRRVVGARAPEVALLVHEAVAHVPVLAHAHEGRIHDGLAVRVVVTRCGRRRSWRTSCAATSARGSAGASRRGCGAARA